jgi:hypothetical protein
MSASKNADKKRGKPFEKGRPGGPGRPEGSRNKASLLLDQLATEEGQEILRKVVEAAKGGDARSAEIILSRIWPVRKGGRPVTLQLPQIDTANDLVKALGVVANAVGAGEITADEGAAVASVIETKRRAIETNDLEQRIATLEKERSK